ncbi:siderophore-interacting protein [Promicromonospora sp. NPDC057488]|uniref:siderophore-interacting protein n=1 Tax=Promicromonospora sp. NPDC057488 TaxID=3346147 RepID=UPI00366CC524
MAMTLTAPAVLAPPVPARPVPTRRPLKPAAAQVRTFEVVASRAVSPGFRRVTVQSTGDGFEDEFEHFGHDHWFRLFFAGVGQELDLPFGPADGWYARLLAMPEATRPAVRNYTVREARRVGGRWQLDVDFVVHRDAAGQVDGAGARWAQRCRTGERVGLLDQGRIFDADEHAGPVLVIADESGLPGVEGIAHALAGRDATYLLEVPHAADRRALPAVDVRWLVRDGGRPAGATALDALRATRVDPAAYVYVVGEASFTLAARAHCLAAGVPKSRIDFCAYWRTDRVRA